MEDGKSTKIIAAAALLVALTIVWRVGVFDPLQESMDRQDTQDAMVHYRQCLTIVDNTYRGDWDIHCNDHKDMQDKDGHCESLPSVEVNYMEKRNYEMSDRCLNEFKARVK